MPLSERDLPEGYGIARIGGAARLCRSWPARQEPRPPGITPGCSAIGTSVQPFERPPPRSPRSSRSAASNTRRRSGGPAGQEGYLPGPTCRACWPRARRPRSRGASPRTPGSCRRPRARKAGWSAVAATIRPKSKKIALDAIRGIPYSRRLKTKSEPPRGWGGSDRLPSIHVGRSAPGNAADSGVSAGHEASGRRQGRLAGRFAYILLAAVSPLRRP